LWDDIVGEEREREREMMSFDEEKEMKKKEKKRKKKKKKEKKEGKYLHSSCLNFHVLWERRHLPSNELDSPKLRESSSVRRW
jgi:hypothetical protein